MHVLSRKKHHKQHVCKCVYKVKMNNTAADARFTGEKTTPTLIPICLLLPAPWPFARLMLNGSSPNLSLPHPHNASPISAVLMSYTTPSTSSLHHSIIY